MKGAMAIDGKTGAILGNKLNIKHVEKGLIRYKTEEAVGAESQEIFDGFRAASAIAMEGFFVVYIPKNCCMPGGDEDGRMQVFAGEQSVMGPNLVPKIHNAASAVEHRQRDLKGPLIQQAV